MPVRFMTSLLRKGCLDMRPFRYAWMKWQDLGRWREGGKASRGANYSRDAKMCCLIKGFLGLPIWFSSKESTCQSRRHRRPRFDPRVGKIPWRRKWQPTPVFLPGEFHNRGAWWTAVHEVAESWTRLSTHRGVISQPSFSCGNRA